MISTAWKILNRFLPWGLPALLGLAMLSGSLGIVQSMEWRSLDWRTRYRVPFQAEPDPRVRLVLFDDDTYVNLVTWPPSREYHGTLIELLSLEKASVVAFDVIFDAKRDDGGDVKMAQAMTRALARGTKTVSGAVTSEVVSLSDGLEEEGGPTRPLLDFKGDIRKLAGDSSALRPFPELREKSWYGFVDQPHDTGDGMLREPPLVVRVGDRVFPGLGLQTLMAHFNVASDAVRVRLGDAVYLPTETRGVIRIPVSDSGRLLLNYRYEMDAEKSNFPAYGYRSLLLGLYSKHVDHSPGTPEPPPLDNSLVIVGQYITGNADAGPTPRSSMSPLPLVHANLINNVLADDYARRGSPWIVWLAVGAWLWWGLRLFSQKSLTIMVVFAIASLLAYVGIAFWLWVQFSLWVPLVAPVGGILLVQFWVIGRRVRAEQRAKEQIRGTFNSYLSPGLLERVIDHGGPQMIESERKPVTILFSDLRDFTSWSETTPENVLIAQLNEYLSAMVDCIHENGGTLHKFIGDAVMAVWGDLVSEGVETDAERACRAALSMQRRLQELNETWRQRGDASLRMGIGLNHGVVLTGNIGSPRKMEFAVIGDAVNMASRLESLNKQLGTAILVGASVAQHVSGKFVLKNHGLVPIKGKACPVEVRELLHEVECPS